MNLACQWFVVTAEFFRVPPLRALWILSTQLCVCTRLWLHCEYWVLHYVSLYRYECVRACICVCWVFLPVSVLDFDSCVHVSACTWIKLGGGWWHVHASLSTAHLLSLSEWREGDTLQLNKTWVQTHCQQLQASAGWYDRRACAWDSNRSFISLHIYHNPMYQFGLKQKRVACLNVKISFIFLIW